MDAWFKLTRGSWALTDKLGNEKVELKKQFDKAKQNRDDAMRAMAQERQKTQKSLRP